MGSDVRWACRVLCAGSAVAAVHDLCAQQTTHRGRRGRDCRQRKYQHAQHARHARHGDRSRDLPAGPSLRGPPLAGVVRGRGRRRRRQRVAAALAAVCVAAQQRRPRPCCAGGTAATAAAAAQLLGGERGRGGGRRRPHALVEVPARTRPPLSDVPLRRALWPQLRGVSRPSLPDLPTAGAPRCSATDCRAVRYS